MKIGKEKKNLNVKWLFRRNQIIVTTLAIMIAAAGYLNYAGKKELAAVGGSAQEAGAMEISDEDILAENQVQNVSQDLEPGTGSKELQEIASWDTELEDTTLADSSQTGTTLADASQTSGTAAGAGTQDTASDNTETAGDAAAGLENPGEAVLTSGMSVSEYIAGVQLTREQIRAKNKETLLGIINNTNIEEAAKAQAIQDMIELTEISEKENAAETLLMAKGFSDPVVSVTSGKVDVIINAPSITDPERAQIEDIVKRKTEVGAENIVITLLKTEE